MRLKLFACVWFAILGLSPVALSAGEPDAAAAASCCQQQEHHAAGCCAAKAVCPMGCCQGGDCDMPCCKEGAEVAGNALEMLLQMDPDAILPITARDSKARQTLVVWFERPVWVGRNVLMGKYVIEHDADRQARGEPCTHVYAANDLKTPVAVFHCSHLASERTDTATVMLQTLPDGVRKLLQFQFAGESAAHGVPADR